MDERCKRPVITSRQNHGQQPNLPHHGNRRRWIRRGKEFDQFLAYPLSRKGRNTVKVARNRRQGIRVKPQIRVPVPGMKPEITKRTQVILTDPIFRSANKSDPARHEVRQPVERVNHLAIWARIERIHGEIPARGVFLDAIGKGNDRPATIRCDIPPKGRDFIGH